MFRIVAVPVPAVCRTGAPTRDGGSDMIEQPGGVPGDGRSAPTAASSRASSRASTSAAGVPRWGVYAGYAAFGCALLFAVVSGYWALGGTLGLDTVGREAVRLSRSGDVGIRLALWLVSLLKLIGALLALALVRPWGSRLLRRWMLLLAGWGGAALLVAYGTAQIGIQVLVVVGVIAAPSDMDWRGFHGHLYLWDPWFVVWGLLLGATVLGRTRAGRSPVGSPERG